MTGLAATKPNDNNVKCQRQNRKTARITQNFSLREPIAHIVNLSPHNIYQVVLEGVVFLYSS